MKQKADPLKKNSITDKPLGKNDTSERYKWPMSEKKQSYHFVIVLPFKGQQENTVINFVLKSLAATVDQFLHNHKLPNLKMKLTIWIVLQVLKKMSW